MPFHPTSPPTAGLSEHREPGTSTGAMPRHTLTRLSKFHCPQRVPLMFKQIFTRVWPTLPIVSLTTTQRRSKGKTFPVAKVSGHVTKSLKLLQLFSKLSEGTTAPSGHVTTTELQGGFKNCIHVKKCISVSLSFCAETFPLGFQRADLKWSRLIKNWNKQQFNEVATAEIHLYQKLKQAAVQWSSHSWSSSLSKMKQRFSEAATAEAHHYPPQREGAHVKSIPMKWNIWLQTPESDQPTTRLCRTHTWNKGMHI